MKTLSLYLFVLIALTSALFSQEIPNGDGDVLWERSLKIDGKWRNVLDAKFHPINGNILVAMVNEIWEIDPKDGHTIRVFEGGTASGKDDQFEGIQITSDGKTILTDGGSGIEGLLIWDYETGKIRKVFDKGGPNRGSLGIFPDNKRAIFFSFKLQGSLDRQIVIYNFETNQIEKQICIAPYAAEKLALSKDGKYLAIGKTYNDNGNWTMTMELWDAETLTKIKDFGNTSSDVVEFREVQISNDNQYIGFVTAGDGVKLHLFNSTNTVPIKVFENYLGFAFSNDCRKILFSSPNISQTEPITNILSLSKFDTIYQYLKSGNFFRINSQNEIFTLGFVTKTVPPSIKFLSNNWYEVGVSNPQETESILYPNPTTDYITLNIPPLEKRGLGGVLQDIRIFDVFGNCVLTVGVQNFEPLQRVDISGFPAGVYFVRIGEEVRKFIKI
jgi:WD40 repeat protein